MVTLENVSFHYTSEIPFVRDISLNLKKGNILGLLGHNGSGKSTLMKLMGGLLMPISGIIEIEDRPMEDWHRRNLYRKLVMMIEEPALYSHLSILDNLKVRARYYQISTERIMPLLQMVHMDRFHERKVAKLSTGMKQRVGLAATLLPDPQILLLDEPTNGMDPEGIIEIRNLILRLADEGKTIIVSSHLLSEIEKIADQVMILKNGRCVFQGNIRSLEGHRDLESIYLSYA